MQATPSKPVAVTGIHFRTVLDAIWQPIFVPCRFALNTAAYSLVIRYGWILIVVRWLYYTIVFQYRDYKGSWSPFARPPFGLSIDAYAAWQRSLALPFGLMLMGSLAAGLILYLWLHGKPVGFRFTLNVLGATFFLPFVLLQPCDRLLVAVAGWQMLPVIVLHTAVLAWESWAAVEIVSANVGMNRLSRFGGILLLCAMWIGIVSPVWR